MRFLDIQRENSVLFKRLMREHIKPYMKQLIIAVICMVIVAACTGGVALMIRPVINNIFIEKNRVMLLVLPFAVFGVICIGAVANYANVLYMRFVGQRIVADMQMRIFDHLMQSDIGLFHNESSGRLISRFTNDINLLRNAFSNVLTSLVKSTLTTMFLVSVMIYESPTLALISLIAFPLAIHPLIKLGKRLRRISDRTQTQLGEFTAMLDETFSGVRTVKSYNRENFEIIRTHAMIESLFKLYYKSVRAAAAAGPMMEILSGVSIALVIWYGGMQVLDGQTTTGAFSSFIGSFLLAYKPVRSMSGTGGTLQEGFAAANRLFNVIDTNPAIADKPGVTPLAIKKGRITYDHVTFHYTKDTPALQEVSFEVPAGKTAALVGLSGGGKSTLMNLLLRFYDVNGGSISIDGQDIREVTLHSLRDAMGFVPQESMLFDDSVRANIAYGREGATEEDIIEAAKGAAAHEFILALPHGYDTMIGSNGVRLSGGQRQRLAIARAMLKNAPILLLDEATSSLDNESERSIQQALKKLMQGRTTLVIAHRLSTIVGADVIYVVEGGRITESGTHDSLMEDKGKYYQLYARSAQTGTL